MLDARADGLSAAVYDAGARAAEHVARRESSVALCSLARVRVACSAVSSLWSEGGTVHKPGASISLARRYTKLAARLQSEQSPSIKRRRLLVEAAARCNKAWREETNHAAAEPNALRRMLARETIPLIPSTANPSQTPPTDEDNGAEAPTAAAPRSLRARMVRRVSRGTSGTSAKAATSGDREDTPTSRGLDISTRAAALLNSMPAANLPTASSMQHLSLPRPNLSRSISWSGNALATGASRSNGSSDPTPSSGRLSPTPTTAPGGVVTGGQALTWASSFTGGPVSALESLTAFCDGMGESVPSPPRMHTGSGGPSLQAILERRLGAADECAIGDESAVVVVAAARRKDQPTLLEQPGDGGVLTAQPRETRPVTAHMFDLQVREATTDAGGREAFEFSPASTRRSSRDSMRESMAAEEARADLPSERATRDMIDECLYRSWAAGPVEAYLECADPTPESTGAGRQNAQPTEPRASRRRQRRFDVVLHGWWHEQLTTGATFGTSKELAALDEPDLSSEEEGDGAPSSDDAKAARRQRRRAHIALTTERSKALASIVRSFAVPTHVMACAAGSQREEAPSATLHSFVISRSALCLESSAPGSDSSATVAALWGRGIAAAATAATGNENASGAVALVADDPSDHDYVGACLTTWRLHESADAGDRGRGAGATAPLQLFLPRCTCAVAHGPLVLDSLRAHLLDAHTAVGGGAPGLRSDYVASEPPRSDARPDESSDALPPLQPLFDSLSTRHITLVFTVSPRACAAPISLAAAFDPVRVSIPSCVAGAAA